MSKIIVVDDDPEKRVMIVRALQRLGHEATSVEHGSTVLQLLAQATVPFDVVVTDYSMPYMNGVELTTRIHDMFPTGPRPTVVMISGKLPPGTPDFAVQTPMCNWTAFNNIITNAGATRS